MAERRQQRPASALEAVLTVAFPFCVSFDRELAVGFTGPSLHLVCPTAVPGASIASLVRVESPATPLCWAALTARAGELTVLVLPSAIGGPLRLRGQFVTQPASDTCFFLGPSGWKVPSSCSRPASPSTTSPRTTPFSTGCSRPRQTSSPATTRPAWTPCSRPRSGPGSSCSPQSRRWPVSWTPCPTCCCGWPRTAPVLTVRASASTELSMPAADHVGRDAFTAFPGMADGLRAAMAGAGSDCPVCTFEFDEELDGALRHFEARVACTDVGDLLLLVRDVTSSACWPAGCARRPPATR
jgi:hypothetical protein